MIVDTERIESEPAYADELRHKCETDHFFLGRLMLGRKYRFDPVLHKPAVDLYFPKNRNRSIEAQHPIKNRMHLDPRLTFKTTLGRVDDVQWYLTFPEDITALNQTATQDLAWAISKSEADYFWRPKGRPETVLQRLYPHLVTDREPFLNASRWNIATHSSDGGIDSTISFTSPKSVQSGWHPYLLNSDDLVETKNSGKNAAPEVRQEVIDTYRTNRYTLMPGGYNNIRGTRYHPFELYGDLLEKMDPSQWRVLIRGAMLVKNGQRLMPGEFPAEDDVELLFAALPDMDYASLKQRFHDNYDSFMCQMMNDPQGGNVPLWDEKLWLTMMIEPERIPPVGETYCCWRFPYGAKKHMQAAEGIAARIYEGKVHVLDAWTMADPSPSRLAEKVVREAKRQQTTLVLAEDFPGVHYLEGHIRNEAIKKNVSLKFNWMYFEEDDNQRVERMRATEPQCRSGKVLISTASGKLAEMKRQFCNFGLVSENGLVDCVSQMARKVPLSLLRTDIEEDEKEMQIRARNAVMSRFIYGDGIPGVQALEDERAMREMASMAALDGAQSFGLTDVLGGLDG